MNQEEITISQFNLPPGDLEYATPDGKYWFRFQHLFEGVFIVESKGFLNSDAIEAQYNVGNLLRLKLAEINPDLKYQLLWDVTKLSGASLLARRYVHQAASTQMNFGGVILIGANIFIRNFGKMMRMVIPHFNIGFAANREEAMQMIKRKHIFPAEHADEEVHNELLNEFDPEDWSEITEEMLINQQIQFISRPEWNYNSSQNQYSLRSSVLDGNILILEIRGFAHSKDIEATYEMMQHIIQEQKLHENKAGFYSMIDMRHLSGVSVNARQKAREMELKYPGKSSLFFVIPSPLIRIFIKLMKSRYPADFGNWNIVYTFNDAMDGIKQHRKGIAVEEINQKKYHSHPKDALPDDPEKLKEIIHDQQLNIESMRSFQKHEISRLFSIASRMTWDQSLDKKIEFDFDDNKSAFADLYNALGIIHNDFHEVIKARDKHARELRESEDKYKNLINLANDLILVVTDNIIRFSNLMLDEILGYNGKELLDYSLFRLTDDDNAQLIKTRIENLYTQNKKYDVFEAILRHKNEKEVAVSINIGKITFEQENAVLMIVRDITNKKIVEEELETYRKHLERLVKDRTDALEREITERKIAEESDKLKSAFLANMSHEIRTPMNAIIAFSEFLREPDLPQHEKTEYLDYIKSNGRSLLTLIDDILDIARIEAGQTNIKLEKCNINAILNELLVFYNENKKQRQKEHLQIIIRKAIASDQLLIKTDPYRLRQILNNLIGNAMKYTERGYIEIGYDIPDAKMIQFYVKDTGIGIQKDKLPYIFERFRQVESEYNRKFKGTGLGLAISKNLVELMGGSIHVESVPDEGSTFYFSLPFKAGEENPEENIPSQHTQPAPKEFYDFSNKIILIAEDEEVNFRILKITLEKTNAIVVRAYNGAEALEICKSQHIDMVLMDLQMPEMDGYEATVRIKQVKPGLPIVAQTANAMPEEKEKCLAMGFDDYLGKPIQLSELQNKVNYFLNRTEA